MPVTLPDAILNDDRLNGRDLRVLAAICFYLSKNEGNNTPDRKTISDVTKVPESEVSRARSRLVDFEYLTKTGGGRYTKYEASKVILNVDSYTQEAKPNVDSYTQEAKPNVDSYTQKGSTRKELSNNIKTEQITISDQSKTDNNFSSNLSSQELNQKIVVEIMVSHGMPERLASNELDRQLINQWLELGLTQAQLTRACKQASKGKSDGEPWGPRYINACLKQIRQEVGNAASNDISGRDYDEAL